MNIKMNIALLACCLILPLASQAQSIGQCSNTTVSRVSTGDQFGTVLGLTNAADCGAAGFVCIADIGETNSATYAAALTAQATGSDVTVRWDGLERGCGALDLPMVFDLVVFPAP